MESLVKSLLPLLFFIVAVVLAVNYGKWADRRFVKNKMKPSRKYDLNDVNLGREIIVTFVFQKPVFAFAYTASPRIIIDSDEEFMFNKNELTIKLHRNFSFKFYQPYMMLKMFKSKGSYNLEPGYHYEIWFGDGEPLTYYFTKHKIMNKTPIERELFTTSDNLEEFEL